MAAPVMLSTTASHAQTTTNGLENAGRAPVLPATL
jgi:hypothetical protein